MALKHAEKESTRTVETDIARKKADIFSPSTMSPIEIPEVSEDLYEKTIKELAGQGYKLIVDIEPLKISQLAKDKITRPLFGYINPSEEMRSNFPPKIKIAINPDNVKIEGSNNLPSDAQAEMIGIQEAILRNTLSEDVRDNIFMLRPSDASASIFAQLDFRYQEQTGKRLFADYFARTDDQTHPGWGAIVGRNPYLPSNGLIVVDRNFHKKSNIVFGISVVLLPQKLSG